MVQYLISFSIDFSKEEYAIKTIFQKVQKQNISSVFVEVPVEDSPEESYKVKQINTYTIGKTRNVRGNPLKWEHLIVLEGSVESIVHLNEFKEALELFKNDVANDFEKYITIYKNFQKASKTRTGNIKSVWLVHTLFLFSFSFFSYFSIR